MSHWNMSEGDCIRLSALGVRLEGPIGTRLQREVEERERVTLKAALDLAARERAEGYAEGCENSRKRVVGLIFVAATGWFGFLVSILLALRGRG